MFLLGFFFSSRRRHTRWPRDWSSDVCSSDLRWIRLCRRPASLSSETRSFSDCRTWRSSIQAPLKALAPSQIRNRRMSASAELRTAMPRMRQRTGRRRMARCRALRSSRSRAAAVRLAGAGPAGAGPAIGAASGDVANAVDKRLDLRIGQRAFVNAGHGPLERRPVNVLDDGDAAELGLAARALLPDAPLLAHEDAGFARRLAEDRLVLGREADPRLLGHDEHLGRHRVLGQGVVRRRPIVPGRDEGRPIVLGAIDELGRQAGHHLPVGQRHRRHAERLEHVGHEVRLLDADAQAFQILELPDRTDAVVDRARAGIVEGQADEAAGVEALQDVVADRAVEDPVQVIDRAEQERQHEHVRLGREARDRGDVDAVEVDRAGPRLLHRLLLLAELARVEDLQPVAAVGALLQQLVEMHQRLDGRIVLGLDVGGPQGPRLGDARLNGGEEKCEACRPSGHAHGLPRPGGGAYHSFLPRFWLARSYHSSRVGQARRIRSARAATEPGGSGQALYDIARALPPPRRLIRSPMARPTPSGISALDAIRPFRWKIALTYALTLVEDLLELSYPWATGVAINGLIEHEYKLALPIVIAWSLRSAIGLFRQMYDTRVYTRVYNTIVERTILRQRAAGIKASNVAARSAMSRDFVTFFEKDVPVLVGALIGIFGSVAILFWYDLVIGALVAFLFLPALIVNRIYVRRHAAPERRAQQPARARGAGDRQG